MAERGRAQRRRDLLTQSLAARLCSARAGCRHQQHDRARHSYLARLSVELLGSQRCRSPVAQQPAAPVEEISSSIRSSRLSSAPVPVEERCASTFWLTLPSRAPRRGYHERRRVVGEQGLRDPARRRGASAAGVCRRGARRARARRGRPDGERQPQRERDADQLVTHLAPASATNKTWRAGAAGISNADEASATASPGKCTRRSRPAGSASSCTHAVALEHGSSPLTVAAAASSPRITRSTVPRRAAGRPGGQGRGAAQPAPRTRAPVRGRCERRGRPPRAPVRLRRAPRTRRRRGCRPRSPRSPRGLSSELAQPVAASAAARSVRQHAASLASARSSSTAATRPGASSCSTTSSEAEHGSAGAARNSR